MLDKFITANRATLIAMSRARVGTRRVPKPTDEELTNGIPMFLDQLCDALRQVLKDGKDSNTEQEAIGSSATRHGSDLLRMGLTVSQVVHDYGDVCHAITELAMELDAPIQGAEFKTLNLCLDIAIAKAVTEFTRLRERALVDESTERLGVLAHELRNQLGTAMLTFDSIRTGRVAVGGSTGVVHERSLLRLRDLIDYSLADVRLDAGSAQLERLSVAEFLEEVEVSVLLQAKLHDLHFSITTVDRAVFIDGDRQILSAALANLLQNAFKFTRKNGYVTLTTTATADRVLFEVADECGGLPPGKSEDLFKPFEQRSASRIGIGLGLFICLKAARANGGELRVRDIPGTGCVFTLDLPRKVPAREA